MSSSGHGQSYVHNEEELETAYKDAMEEGRGDIREVIIEELIDFQLEFVLLTVTQKNGPTSFLPSYRGYPERWRLSGELATGN
jgi:phosphoribosylglycinamide formyltransferase 2